MTRYTLLAVLTAAVTACGPDRPPVPAEPTATHQWTAPTSRLPLDHLATETR